jgi:hypothetical protein
LRSCNRFTSLYPTAAAFRHGTSWLSTKPEGSKADEKWRGDVPLQNYRAQFEEEFGRLKMGYGVWGIGYGEDVSSQVSDTTVSSIAATRFPDSIRDLQSEAPTPKSQTPNPENGVLAQFVKNEIDMLEELLGILTGTGERAAERLDFLLDELDYLWAHFPDCAGAGGRRPATSDIAFLKRVRAEIEPCLALWKRAPR